MVKKLTTFKVDLKTWQKFEDKRRKSINLEEKYATMNKSRIINELVKDFVEGKTIVELAEEEKPADKYITQAFHLDLDLFLALEKKLGEEKAKYTDNIEVFSKVGTKNNAIVKLIKNYIKV